MFFCFWVFVVIMYILNLVYLLKKIIFDNCVWIVIGIYLWGKCMILNIYKEIMIEYIYM